MESEALAKEHLKWLKILTVAVLALLCLALVFSAVLLRSLRTAGELTAEIQTVAARLDTLTAGLDAEELHESVEALERTAQALEKVDYERLSTTAIETLELTRESLGEISQAMDKMDFEALNEAIANLQTVIAPLAAFTARFS